MKLIIICISALFLIECKNNKSEKSGLEGKPFPTFSMLLSDSLTWYNTEKLPPGKPIVLLYYNPTCPYCKSQMKEIADNMDDLKNVQFCLVSNHPFTQLKKFYSDYQLNKYPNIIAGLDTSNFVGDYFEAIGVPFMAIYGSDKKLNKTYLGKVYRKQIVEAIRN